MFPVADNASFCIDHVVYHGFIEIPFDVRRIFRYGPGDQEQEKILVNVIDQLRVFDLSGNDGPDKITMLTKNIFCLQDVMRC